MVVRGAFVGVSVLVLAALAGCAGQEKAPEGSANASPTGPLSEDGRDLTVDLRASDQLPAPAWHLGHLFKNHIFFSPDDEQGYHWDSAVVEDKGNKWLLATTDPMAAQYEAMFDLFMLGEFEKDDLTTTSVGNPHYWYEFPLTDNKTWTRSVQYSDFNGGGADVTVNFVSSYNPKISTPLGDRPGFDIKATTTEGKLFMVYDYVPALGWYAHFWQYDPTGNVTNPETDWYFHMMSMGVEMGWSGAYFVDTAKEVLNTFRYMAVDPDNPTNSGVSTESPHSTFMIEEGARYVHGFIFAFAFTGIHEIVLVDPENNHEQFEAQAGPLSFSETFQEYVGTAKPGEWKVENIGAGVAAGGGAFLFQITEEERHFGGHEGH